MLAIKVETKWNKFESENSLPYSTREKMSQHFDCVECRDLRSPPASYSIFYIHSHTSNIISSVKFLFREFMNLFLRINGVRYEWCSQFRNKQINASYSSMERVLEMIVVWHPTKQRPMKCIVLHEHVHILRKLLIIIIIIYSTLGRIHNHSSSDVHTMFAVFTALLYLYQLYEQNRCSVPLHYSSIHSFFIASIVGAFDASSTNLIYATFSFKLIDSISAHTEGISWATDE